MRACFFNFKLLILAGDRMIGGGMTDLLYLQDSYFKQFKAEVIDVSDLGVCLDQTAFYPGGGGQPYDQGVLHSDDANYEVPRMKRKDGSLWHVLEDNGLEKGSQVVGEIDWDRRYQLMRVHTAMHILCGVIWRDYGASVTGGNMEPLRGRMDFEFESLTKDLVAEIEQKINLEVEAARPIKVETLPREEAFEIPDLIRTKVNLLPPSIKQVRTVEIEGLDLQADGGTHVANTEEVGLIRIVDYKSKGAINKRLVVELEA
jgi:misacylated tRNA(Ala) deacylase